MPNIYKVSCYSNCGTYFMSYLKSVTVIAENKEQAVEKTKEWLKDANESFLYEEKKWDISLVHKGVAIGVIDSHSDSDY